MYIYIYIYIPSVDLVMHYYVSLYSSVFFWCYLSYNIYDLTFEMHSKRYKKRKKYFLVRILALSIPMLCAKFYFFPINYVGLLRTFVMTVKLFIKKLGSKKYPTCLVQNVIRMDGLWGKI